MRKLIVSLAKKKLFKNGAGGLKIPRNLSRSHSSVSQAVTTYDNQGLRKMHQGLKNLSIKPLKFKF